MGLRDEYDRRWREWSDINEHLPALFEAVMQAPSSQPLVVELGTRTGNSTAALLYGLQVRQGGHLYSIDPEVPDVPDEWYHNGQWHYMRGLSFDCVPDISDVPVHGIDVLFVDSSHTYDDTLRELELFMPLVKPGGVALFHDTMVMNDVCDVARALTHYCAEHGLVWTETRTCYGLGRIEVPR